MDAYFDKAFKRFLEDEDFMGYYFTMFALIEKFQKVTGLNVIDDEIPEKLPTGTEDLYVKILETSDSWKTSSFPGSYIFVSKNKGRTIKVPYLPRALLNSRDISV